MRALAGALGFFSTLPVGRDERSFEALRRNLWILPVVGLILGSLISVSIVLLGRLAFLGILFYLAIEGINHVDALADFGDALFAPKDRKLKALKDLNTGVGGTVAVSVYVFTLMWSFRTVVPLAVVDAQMMAKFGMLLLLTTTSPIWEGMGAYMMEFAGFRDLCVGGTIVAVTTALLSKFDPSVVLSNVMAVVVCVLYRFYVVRTFGGVNGDLIGALNCIAFATTLLSFSAFRRPISI